MKSNLLLRWNRGRDELLDRFEDDRELFVVFFLERFDFPREIAVCVHEPAELHERAHDRNIYFDCAGAAKHAGKHRDALLSECNGQRIGTTVLL